MTALLWFKRDLRLADNAALHRALRYGAPLPVYICEPDYWCLDDTSGRQFAFLRESLAELRRDLRALGSDLVIRTGGLDVRRVTLSDLSGRTVATWAGGGDYVLPAGLPAGAYACEVLTPRGTSAAVIAAF